MRRHRRTTFLPPQARTLASSVEGERFQFTLESDGTYPPTRFERPRPPVPHRRHRPLRTRRVRRRRKVVHHPLLPEHPSLRVVPETSQNERI